MPSTYTFTTKSPETDRSGMRYASQPADGAHVAIQGIGNGIQTSDASSTAVKSGVALTSTPTLLKTPDSAVTLTMLCNVSFTFSEINSATQAVTVPANTFTPPINVANCQEIYVASSGASPVLSFFYTIV